MAAKNNPTKIDLNATPTCTVEGANLKVSLPDGNDLNISLMVTAREMDTLVAQLDGIETAMNEGTSPSKAWDAFKTVLPSGLWEQLLDLPFQWALAVAKAWMEQTFGGLGKALTAE